MNKPLKTMSEISKKRKMKAKVTVSEPKTMKLDIPKSPLEATTQNTGVQKISMPPVMYEGLNMDDISARYPVFKNEELVKKFLSVSMTNNQKGRIRQLLKDNLKGTSDLLLPDVIHHKIQGILKSAENLTDSDLRKVRILYNMLKVAMKDQKVVKNKQTKSVAKDKKLTVGRESKSPVREQKNLSQSPEKEEIKTETKKKIIQKAKGPKRYVVFLGNLPLEVDKEMIMRHFRDIGDRIRDVRIPKRNTEKKGGMAYLELGDELSYEMALSKHHSMLCNKRINVQYTTQKKTKISKEEAKSKSAKLMALQRSGKLLGSVPLNKKRSQRRKKMKAAQAKQAENA